MKYPFERGHQQKTTCYWTRLQKYYSLNKKLFVRSDQMNEMENEGRMGIPVLQIVSRPLLDYQSSSVSFVKITLLLPPPPPKQDLLSTDHSHTR
jgi:hypothetical protein